MAAEPINDGLHDETVTIRVFSSHEAAELAATNLEAHGIQCWINSDDAGGMLPNLTAPGGVRLLVRASGAEAAIALLDAQGSPTEIKQIETEAIASAPPETVPPKKLALGQIMFSTIIGVVLGVMLCLLYQRAEKLGTKTYYHHTTDGKIDEAWIYRDGHLVEFRQDRNLDGEWDHRVYYENGAWPARNMTTILTESRTNGGHFRMMEQTQCKVTPILTALQMCFTPIKIE